jgi:iron(III) transport system ATP-binding protein
VIGIHSLRKTFKTGADSVRAVDGVDLQVNEKEFFVLLGLSGSGKTTLLRCVAGLERPEAGEIVLGEQIVSSAEPGHFRHSGGQGDRDGVSVLCSVAPYDGVR